MNNKKVMQQALEALERCAIRLPDPEFVESAITALRAALAEPDVPEVCFWNMSDTLPPLLPCPFCGERPRMTLRPDDAHWRDFFSPAIAALEAALAQHAANVEPYILQAPALAMRNPQRPESRQEMLPAGTAIYTAPTGQ